MIPQMPTPAGFAAHLDRGSCGHILCAFAEECVLSVRRPTTDLTRSTDSSEAS